MNKHRSLIVTAAVAVLSALYVFVIFLPGQRYVAQLKEQLTAKHVYLTQSTNTPLLIAQLSDEIERTRQFQMEWKKTAPQNDNLANVFRRWTDEARSAAVAVVNIHPGTPESLKTLRFLPLNLSVEGSFHPICDFLHRLEASPEHLTVNELKIQPVGKDGKALRCEVNVTIFADRKDISD